MTKLISIIFPQVQRKEDKEAKQDEAKAKTIKDKAKEALLQLEKSIENAKKNKSKPKFLS